MEYDDKIDRLIEIHDLIISASELPIQFKLWIVEKMLQCSIDTFL